MYKVINTDTGETSTVNFQKMSEILGVDIDADFFSPMFTAHSMTVGDVQYMIMEVEK